MAKPGNIKKRILVIDDEPIVGRMCQRVLQGEGFEVDLVNNGLSAREIASEKNYDFCVSDIRLPGVTGIELFEHWKSSANPLAEHLIFVTGDTLNNNIQAFLERSGAPCLLKPFDPEELCSFIRKALSPKAASSV